MNQPIALLLGVHAHQPVGNFPAVIAEAHERCYRPFLQTLHRYPDFRFGAHFSGWLLDFLCQQYPRDMELLGDMVARGQTEMFGGGECEPVLAAISARDRVGQVRTLSDKISRRFGQAPRGAWLTERVWEATVVPELADADIAYAMVDDFHFLCTGMDAGRLDSYYTTEENGRTLDLFPVSEALRYRLPFSPAADAVHYLEQMADEGRAAAIYFDDIEKFGIWPETYDWVYERKWLEQFIEGVLASSRIRTMSYADFHSGQRTRGIVYLPTTSYSEMGEWTLPAPAAGRYHALLAREKTAGTLTQHRPFLRGGIWRNFFSRYPEANWMHKRMLALSQRLAALPAAAADGELRELLYRGQANDAYWHGLFGGLYLPHLRRSVFHHLLRLEVALDRLAPGPAPAGLDLDYDGWEEAFLKNAEVQAVLRKDGLAAVIEFDSYLLAHNFADTLRRHDEHYYLKIGQAQGQAPVGEGIASAHDRVEFKHPIAAADIVPDETGRAMFIDRRHEAKSRAESIATLVDGYGAESDGRFVARGDGWRIVKNIALTTAGVAVNYAFEGPSTSAVSCEINLAMPSCDGYSGRYILADGSIPCGFGQLLELPGVTEVVLDDRELRGRLVLRSSRPVRLQAAPHHTVSQSEAGFEKIMQCVCVTLHWTPASGEEWAISLEVVADRA